MVALHRNWKTLSRQHNLYRYLLSLVVSDLLNGCILLLHSTFWTVLVSFAGNLKDETFPEMVTNLMTGALQSITFASLASATLLNLVMRLSSTRALARAAAIQQTVVHTTCTCVPKVPLLRSRRITVWIISIIWVIAGAFVFIPLQHHCHINLVQCVRADPFDGSGNVTFVVFEGDQMLDPEVESSAYDCSMLRSPSRRIYLLILSSFNAFTWGLLVLCNIATTCVKTKVIRTNSACFESSLTLHRSIGFTRDSSSFFACIITLSMTVSVLPQIVFIFVTEGASALGRIRYAKDVFSVEAVDVFDLSTYTSSLLNPIIYTFMLSRLRGDVSRTLESIRVCCRRRRPSLSPDVLRKQRVSRQGSKACRCCRSSVAENIMIRRDFVSLRCTCHPRVRSSSLLPPPSPFAPDVNAASQRYIAEVTPKLAVNGAGYAIVKSPSNLTNTDV